MMIDREQNSTQQTTAAKGRLIGMDALKTLAIVGVTLFHIFPQVVKGGYLGVSLFFVLTGFLLAYTSQKNWQDGKFSVFSYYGKRIKRIYPELVLVIFVSLGVFKLWLPKVLAGIRPEIISVFLGYNNWWQIAQNADYFTRLANNSPFTHLWFMGIELEYYFIWPFIFLAYNWICKSRSKKAGLTALGVLTVATACVMPVMYKPSMDITRLYYGTDTRIYALLLGAVMGLALQPQALENKGNDKQKSLVPTIAIGLLTVITVVAYAYLDGNNPLVYKGGMLVMTLLFCGLLHMVIYHGAGLEKTLAKPALTWLGKKSYGIFLWQYPVLYFFRHQQWTGKAGYYLAEIMVIILLAVMSDLVITSLQKRQLPWQNHRGSAWQSAVLSIFLLVSVGLTGCGLYGFATASGTAKTAAQAGLKAKLEANAKVLQQQKQQATKQPKVVTQDELSGIDCIGDSIMLSCAREIPKVLPNCYIDAQISRYVGGGLEVVQGIKAQRELSHIVVIGLGTNGPLAGAEMYEKLTQQLLQELGDERLIFWVNVYCPEEAWHKTNNDYINKMAAEHKNITIVDWCGAVSQHQEWLDEDEVHPDEGEGAKHYAKLLRDTIEKKLKETK